MATGRARNSEEPILEVASSHESDTAAEIGCFDCSGSGSSLHDFASIASSIPGYVYQNGRRYHPPHRGENYLLPNDERELERLDLLHHLFRLTLDGDLCYARLDHPENILDLGTGNGNWALDIACEYPAAQVVGTDLSALQPKTVPPNVAFVIEDAIDDWTWPSNSFDFVHIRALGGSIPDWQRLFEQAYRVIKPGGQIEVSEPRTHWHCDDGSLPEDSYTKRWMEEFYRLSSQSNIEFDIMPATSGRLAAAGFTDVEMAERVVPCGTWPRDRRLKERGRYFLAQAIISGGTESFSIQLFTRRGGYAEEEVRTMLDEVARELRGNRMHLYSYFCFCVARKPTS